MADEIHRDLAHIDLPFRRRAIVREVSYDNGLRMIRLVLFEGKRVTQVDLDEATARQLGAALVSGADHVPVDTQQ